MSTEAPVLPPPEQHATQTGLPEGVNVGWVRELGGEWARPESLTSGPETVQLGAPEEGISSEAEKLANVDDELDDLDIQDLFVQGFLAERGENGTISLPSGTEVVSTERFLRWYDSLDDATRDEVDASHRASIERFDVSDQVKEKIEENAPELLEGRLPPELDAVVNFEYGLGTNQTNARDVEEGVAYLEQRSGVHVGEYDLARRFMLFDGSTDPDYATRALSQGYFGSSGGVRFVAVVPKAHEGMSDTSSQSGRGEHVPSDYYVTDSTGQRSVSMKYIAGIVDMEGVFHVNRAFMQDTNDSAQNEDNQSGKID